MQFILQRNGIALDVVKYFYICEEAYKAEFIKERFNLRACSFSLYFLCTHTIAQGRALIA